MLLDVRARVWCVCVCECVSEGYSINIFEPFDRFFAISDVNIVPYPVILYCQ
jgi:hypothetical protein